VTPSLTDSPSSTSTPTSTPTPTDTASPTITQTFSVSPTPVLQPYHVVVALYNSAGELVKRLFDGGAAAKPSGMLTTYLAPTANGSLPIQIQLTGVGNLAPLVWDEVNDNGQAVAGGSYYVKVQSTDPYGNVSTLSQGVTVLPSLGSDSVAIFNSAGELVRTLPLPASGSPVTDISVNGASVGAGKLPVVSFHLTTANGAASDYGWDGCNSLGQPVQSGSYLVRLVRTVAGTGTVVKVLAVTVLALPGSTERSALDAAIIAPQPWTPAQGPGLTVAYPALPGHQVRAQLYDLAGELVTQGLDASGSGQLTVPVARAAGGVYLLRLEAFKGSALLAARTMKVAVLR